MKAIDTHGALPARRAGCNPTMLCMVGHENAKRAGISSTTVIMTACMPCPRVLHAQSMCTACPIAPRMMLCMVGHKNAACRDLAHHCDHDSMHALSRRTTCLVFMYCLPCSTRTACPAAPRCCAWWTPRTAASCGKIPPAWARWAWWVGAVWNMERWLYIRQVGARIGGGSSVECTFHATCVTQSRMGSP